MPIDKPSEAEEEYFARQEAETKRKLARKRHEAMAREEREHLRGMHFMKCPKCGMDLEEVIFRGVKIDRCFTCGGVFLDGPELSTLTGKGHGFVETVVRVFTSGGGHGHPHGGSGQP